MFPRRTHEANQSDGPGLGAGEAVGIWPTDVNSDLVGSNPEVRYDYGRLPVEIGARAVDGSQLPPFID